MTTPAVLLQDFVNTLDVESGAEQFGTPAELVDWLAQRHLTPAGAAADAADLRMATALREGLRAAMLSHQMLSHHGPQPQPLPAGLEDVLARLPLRVSLASGQPSLAPVDGGVAGGLGGLAAAVMAVVADGTWPRLKVCQEVTCHAAFLDTSKNRSRAWCSMELCGNRAKTRAYRARRRSGTTR